MGFIPLTKECCIFKNSDGSLILLYVDDLLIAATSLDRISAIKSDIHARFKYKDMKEVQSFLGFQIHRDRALRRIYICQKTFVEGMLRRFFTDPLRSKKTPMEPGSTWPPARPTDHIRVNPDKQHQFQSQLGSIWWPTNGSRPDCALASSKIAQGQADPYPQHFAALKHIFAYLEAKPNLAIVLGGPEYTPENVNLRVPADASFADHQENRRSTAGYVVMAGGGPIIWKSALQTYVAGSTLEAEFTNFMPAIKAAIWVHDMLKELGLPQPLPIRIESDSTNAISNANDPHFSSKIRHMDIKYKWIKEHVAKCTVEPVYVSTKEMVADGLTKPLVLEKHIRFIEQLNLQPFPEKPT